MRLFYALVILLSVVFWFAVARGEDYWTTCTEAYRFCSQRPYHRDCAVWTHRGMMLSVHSFRYSSPERVSPLCKDMPWHLSCGTHSEMIVEHRDCPIPEEYSK